MIVSLIDAPLAPSFTSFSSSVSSPFTPPHFISQFAWYFSPGASPVFCGSVAPDREPDLFIHGPRLWQLHRNQLIHPSIQQLCPGCLCCGSAQPDCLTDCHGVCICHNGPLGHKEQRQMLPEVSPIFHMEIIKKTKVLEIACGIPV